MNRQLFLRARQLVLAAFCCTSFCQNVSAAPIISATQDDGVTPPARKNRGDTITYSTTITNSGDATATGVQVTAPAPANTADVPGSAKVTPIAVDDAYAALGNTLLTRNAAAGVLSNDFDPDGVNPTVKTGSISRVSGTATGGNLSIAADGSFTYTPGVGATGSETFQYTITDTDGQDSVTPGFVTFTMTNRVWYVQNAGTAGDGRSHQPFNSLSAVSTAANLSTDVIYVFSDTGNPALNGPLVLENGQQLLGQGVDLVVGGTTWFTAATAPTLKNASGDIVSLGQSNLVTGLILSDRSGSAIKGATFGTLTINSTTISGSGQALSLTNGTVNGILASVSASGSIGIGLTNVSGSLTMNAGSLSGLSGDDFVVIGGNSDITYAGSINNSSGRSVNVQNRTGGSIVLSGSINDTGMGILIQNNTGGTIAFDGTSKTINTAVNPAITLAGNTGAIINFNNGGLDVDTTTGTAFSVTGGGTVNVSGSVNSINSTSGTAFLNSGAGGSAAIAINAGITNTTGRLLDIQNRTSGTVALSGNMTNAGTGILIQNNTGSTINLSGTIGLNTGVNAGFTATGGGTIIVTGSNNTIVTTSATALRVSNTTIGLGGLNFRSITSIGGNGDGIILDTTGTLAGLTVSGNGSAGTGGTIASKSGSDGSSTDGTGIFLRNTAQISLSHMQLNDHQNLAIYGNGVTNFTLRNSVINGSNGNSTGDALSDGDVSNDDACMSFKNLTGSAGITNCTITGGLEDNVRIVNSSGTLNRVVFNNVAFGLNSTSLGDNGLFIQSQNTAVLNATITNCVFSGARGDVLQFDLTHTGAGDLIFASNSCINVHSAIVTGGGGITLSGGGSVSANPNFTFDVNNNIFRNARGDAILVALQTGTGSFSGRIRNNTIGLAGNNGSGSLEASGIEARVIASSGTVSVTIDNNQIRQYSNYGIYLTGGQGGGIGRVNATVQNNTVGNPAVDSFPIKNGIRVDFGISTGDQHQACVDIKNNSLAGSGNVGQDVRLRQALLTHIRLPGYGGANNDNTAVKNFVEGQNTGAETVAATQNVAGGGGGFVGGALCGTP